MTNPDKRQFSSEAEMCARFLEAVRRDGGWVPYAETAGWDILLVRKSDGFQIGIQAKLKLNAAVINQSIESKWDITRPGPDCRAVLVPSYVNQGLAPIAEFIGITVVAVNPDDKWGAVIIYPHLPKDLHHSNDYSWHEQCPVKRHGLPDYVPDVVAGSSAPIQLTKWKIQAIKIAITLEIRGYVTREDFKFYGIDHRRWIVQQWLVNHGGQMTAGASFPKFSEIHPKSYAEIKEDKNKWMRPAPLLAIAG